jgi:hypothetical protein
MLRAMNTALPSVSEAIVAIHSRFIVEKVWCQNPARLFQRFVEAANAARGTLPTRDHAYFDARIDVIRAEMFCDCEDARDAFARTGAAVRHAA